MGTIRLTEQQADIYSYLFKPLDRNNEQEWKVRNGVVCASRGFGKSYLAGTVAASAISQLETLDRGVPNKQVVIIAPTLASVTSIYQPLLDNEFGFKDIAKFDGRYYTYKFKNNSILRLFSFEMIERLRGQGVHTLICDEITSWSNDDSKVKEAWESVIYPCVTTRWSPMRAKVLEAHCPGRSLTISTPKGFNTFYDLFQMQTTDKDWKSWHFNYRQSPFLSTEEIDKVRRSMDPMKFNREYEASFEESGAQVYHSFDRRIHVREDLSPIEAGEQLFVGLDFNVNYSVWLT
jgi:tRNA(Met) C34 N-acetyltransferase TmcA